MLEFNEGDVLLGKYRIERVLGAGGMGVVVAAMHLQLEERVAIKFLLPDALVNPEATARFAREARAAVKIKSEHVARVLDVGTLDTGAPYMVMELLDGEDLAALVARRGALPIRDAVDYLLQACEALAEAHAIGIIHRDLKPSNLFLTHRADGSACVKVLDFGISKFSSAGSSSNLNMTKTHAIMGSPLYMSPEQMASTRNVDARADIWAAGVVLYELCSGEQPFHAETMPELCAQVLQEAPRDIRSLRPDVPQELEEVVLRCLAKQREQRFAHIGELARSLIPFASRGASKSAERIWKVLSVAGITSGSLATVVVSDPPPRTAQASTQSTSGGLQLGVRAKVGVWVGGIALVVGAATVTLILTHRSGVTPQAASADPEASRTASASANVETSGSAAPTGTAVLSASGAPVVPADVLIVVPAPSAEPSVATPETPATLPATQAIQQNPKPSPRTNPSTPTSAKIPISASSRPATQAPPTKPPTKPPTTPKGPSPSDDDVLRGRR